MPQAHGHRFTNWSVVASAALLQLLSASCADIDLSLANHCASHRDCNSGRVCVEQRCVPIDTAGRQRDGDASTEGRSGSDAPGPPIMPSFIFDPTSRRDAESPTEDAAARDARSSDAVIKPYDNDAQVDDDADVDSDAGASEPEPEPDGRYDLCVDRVIDWRDVSLLLNSAGIIANAQGKIQEWADRSSYHHRALPPNPDPESWPVEVPASDDLLYHGVRFGRTPNIEAPPARRLEIADHTALQFGQEDFALIAVLRYHNDPTAYPDDIGTVYNKACNGCAYIPGAALFANDNYSSPSRGGFIFQTGYGLEVRSAESNLNDDRFHVVTAGRLVTYNFMAIDGGAVTSRDIGYPHEISQPTLSVMIGANRDKDVQVLDGDIFELMVIRGSTTERWQTIASCLMTKYGLR